MEAMANNPSQLKMAADQMKNMSESDIKRAVNMEMPTAGSAAASPTYSASQINGTAPANPPITSISKSQFEAATQQMSSMTPEQLKQQAAMMKSMSLDTIRRTNPQMANMSDEQIRMSIEQLEQMAANPEMMKMASEQMKNMTEEQYESMKRMVGGLNGGGGGGNSNSSTAAAGGMPTDPSQMMEALFSNPEQLNSVIKNVKQNPDMLKNMMGEGKSDAQKEKMARAIDSFAEMDDDQLDRYLKRVNTVQKIAKPVVSAFDKTKRTLGVSTKTLLIMLNMMVFVCFVLIARWWRSKGGGDGTEVEDDVLARSREEMPDIAAGYDAPSEF